MFILSIVSHIAASYLGLSLLLLEFVKMLPKLVLPFMIGHTI